MKINLIYDLIGPDNLIVNGVNLDHLEYFWDLNFNIVDNIEHEPFKKNFPNTTYWNIGSLGSLELNCISISDIDCDSEDSVYLYPVSVNGDYYNSLGLADNQISFFNFLSKNIIELLKTHNNVFLFYEQTGEPYFDSTLLKKIYDDSILFEIPINKILIVNGTNSNQIILDDFIDKYGSADGIRLVTFNWPIPFKSLELRSRLGYEPNKNAEKSTIADISHIKKPKSHKGLFLNRRLRYHRILSLALLAENGTLDSMLYSLDMNLNFYDNFKETLLYNDDTMPPVIIRDKSIHDKLKTGYDILCDINKKTIDFDDLNSVHGYGMETKEIYENTFFSVVSETEFSKFTQSFTEKILKPIMHFHPFFLIGSPYILHHLKKYGFRTFDNWWDESYDTMENDDERLLSVINQIQIVSNLSNSDLYKMLEEMRDVLIHNHNLLISYGGDTIKKMIYRNLKSVIKYEHNVLL